MNTPRCFTPEPLISGASLTLDSGVSNHLCAVLRLKAGAEVTLFNGEGGETRAVLTHADRRKAQVSLLEHLPIEREAPNQLILCQGVPNKGDKMDWIVQKATELGVRTIVPIYSDYASVIQPAEREEKKRQHWQKVLISACEQCGRNRLPILHSPKKITELLSSTPSAMDSTLDSDFWPTPIRHLWFDPDAELTLSSFLQNASFVDASVHTSTGMGSENSTIPPMAIWVGPEGGFSPADTALAHAAGAVRVRAGSRVLRTETAGLAALAVLQAFLGDW